MVENGWRTEGKEGFKKREERKPQRWLRKDERHKGKKSKGIKKERKVKYRK